MATLTINFKAPVASTIEATLAVDVCDSLAKLWSISATGGGGVDTEEARIAARRNETAPTQDERCN